MERTLKDVSVEGVKTRQKPNKHIVFAVKVMWSDGQVNVVSRRYSEFFELMEKLNENFPNEAGKHDAKQRILPNLQAKKTFLVSSSVMKQLERVTEFTKKLVALPDHISQCQIVRDFFKPTQADLETLRRLKSIKNSKKKKKKNFHRKNTAKKVLSIRGPVFLEQYRVIADVVKQCKTGLDLKEGQVVEVIEKLETGWWLVVAEGEQGWVPASYLSNENDPEETMTTVNYEPGKGECYVSNRSYKAVLKDELSFDIGVHLQVIEKNLDGWWKVIYNGCEGLVPAAYLKKVGETKSREDGNKPPPVRKENVLSQRDSRSLQSDMTDETLTKLRESTFKSPEEADGELGVLPKKKLTRVSPKVHLDLRKSVDGGWVPQVIPPSQSLDKERKSSNEKEKTFSLPRVFGNLKKTRKNDNEKNDNGKNQLSKSVVEFNFLKKPNYDAEKNEMVTQQKKYLDVKGKDRPRSRSVVELNFLEKRSENLEDKEKATQQKKYLDITGKDRPRSGSVVELNFLEKRSENLEDKEKATQQKKYLDIRGKDRPRSRSVVELNFLEERSKDVEENIKVTQRGKYKNENKNAKAMQRKKGIGKKPQRSKSAVQDLKFQFPSQNVIFLQEKDLINESRYKQRSNSAVGERLIPSLNDHEFGSDARSPRNARATLQRKYMDGKGKQPQRSKSAVEEFSKLQSPSQNDVENEYISFQEENVFPEEQSKERSQNPKVPRKQQPEQINHAKADIECQDSSANIIPSFVVTSAPLESDHNSKTSTQQETQAKQPLFRQRSYSCTDLVHSSLETVSSVGQEDEDEDEEEEDDDDEDDNDEDDDSFSFDEEEDSEISDFDDICTLDDLIMEEKEMNNGRLSIGELSEDEDKRTTRRGESVDSGTGSTSQPSSPVTIKIPQNKAEGSLYVAIADYQGSKEGGEVDLFEGQQVKVLQKTIGGWWLVEGEEKGWAPSNFLEEIIDTSLEDFSGEQLNNTLAYIGDTGELSKGEKYEVVDTNKSGHFVLVRVPSKYAWVSKSCVLESNKMPQCEI